MCFYRFTADCIVPMSCTFHVILPGLNHFTAIYCICRVRVRQSPKTVNATSIEFAVGDRKKPDRYVWVVHCLLPTTVHY